ncbi:MAG: GIY-YIG nuclease family protein [Patescibacteria group bacterium]
MNYYVYIISNFHRTVLYIGVTSDLHKRIAQHNNEGVQGFSAKYHLTDLIYFEEFSSVFEAISREKQLKGWRRSKKEELINKVNPKWKECPESIPI